MYLFCQSQYLLLYKTFLQMNVSAPARSVVTVKAQTRRTKTQMLWLTSCQSSRSTGTNRRLKLAGRTVGILLSQERIWLCWVIRLKLETAKALAGDEWGACVNGDYEVFRERAGTLNGPTFKQLFKVNRDGEWRDRAGDESRSGHPHYISWRCGSTFSFIHRHTIITLRLCDNQFLNPRHKNGPCHKEPHDLKSVCLNQRLMAHSAALHQCAASNTVKCFP